MKTPFLKRISTWQNIFEAAGVVVVQIAMDWPSEMTSALWVVFGLRVAMAVSQSVKQGVKDAS